MRSIRFILALLIGISLALAPISAAMAGPAMSSGMAMEHCDKTPAKTMSENCNCCDKSDVCRAGSCAGQCANISGYLPVEAKLIIATSQDFPRSSPADVIQRSWPPPAPPPRV